MRVSSFMIWFTLRERGRLRIGGNFMALLKHLTHESGSARWIWVYCIFFLRVAQSATRSQSEREAYVESLHMQLDSWKWIHKVDLGLLCIFLQDEIHLHMGKADFKRREEANIGAKENLWG